MESRQEKIEKKTWEADRKKGRLLFEEYVRTKDPAIKEKIVSQYLNLVRFLAGKFTGRGEPLEDLFQVGCLALLKAVDRYDLSFGVEFTSYVTPTIVGEIKRYFRDKGWLFRVPRRLQELHFAVNQAVKELSSDLHRSPTIKEIAKKLKIAEEEVLEAQELGQSYVPLSLEASQELHGEADSPSLLDSLGKEDFFFKSVDDRLSLEKALKKLDAKERLVVYLRFYKNLSQEEIAGKLNTLQMQISRIQSRAMEKLRKILKQDLVYF